MEKKEVDIMTKLQMVVKNENKSRVECIKAQKKYLTELNKMKAAIKRGEKVDTTSITTLLQNSGFIDKNGEINKRYKAEG